MENFTSNKFLYKWFFRLLLLVIFVAGAALTIYVYNFANQSNLDSLSEGVQTIASSMDLDEISALQGSEADLDNPSYIKLKEKLIKIRSVQEDVRFVYLTAKNDNNEIYFIADSEDPNSEDYSPPGQTYDEADEDFVSVFNSKKPLVYGPSKDRWGNWYTALSPIVDESGQLIAVAGIDVAAAGYEGRLIATTAVPALVTLLLLALVFIGQRMIKHQQQMLEQKSEFVSIASHELRSPLNGITWALQNLRKASNLLPEQTDAISGIASATNNLMGNINDILDASAVTGRATKLLMEPVNINELLKDVIEQQEFNAKQKNVNIDFSSVHSKNYILQIDKEKVRRVISNILSNSIKYSPENSNINIGLEQTADNLVMHFTDQGIGIPKSDQEKIFEGYYRSDNAVKSGVSGTGLGLYFAKKIIEMHRGKLWLKSEVGQGTTFFVQLPIKT